MNKVIQANLVCNQSTSLKDHMHIHDHLEQLEYDMKQLSEAIGHLTTKLQPFLITEPAEVLAKEGCSGVSSDSLLSQRIQDLKSLVRSYSGQIYHLHNRLDI
jgi:flagellar biosynthesis chaperone FliJ